VKDEDAPFPSERKVSEAEDFIAPEDMPE